MPTYIKIKRQFKIHGSLVRRPESPYVYLLGTYPGLGQRIFTCETSDLKKAEKKAQEIERGLSKLDPQTSPKTFGEVAIQLMELNQGQWLTRTEEGASSIINKWLIPAFGRLSIKSDWELQWKRFADKFYEENRGQKLFNKRKYMRKILRYARRKNWVKEDFDLPIRKDKEIQRRGMVFEDCEIEALIANGRIYEDALAFKVFIYLGRYMGLRKGEILSLRREDVDLKEKTLCISLPDSTTKKHAGTLSIASEVWKPLLDYLPSTGEHLFPSLQNAGGHRKLHGFWHSARMKAAKKYPRLKKARIHDLRHSFATVKIHDEKHHLPDVAAYLRNSVVITSTRYAHPSAEHTRHVVSGLG